MKTVEQEQTERAEELKWVLTKNLWRDPDQPRKEFRQEGLIELAASLHAQGQQIPLLVRKAKGNWFVDPVVQHSVPKRQYWQVLDRNRLREHKYEGDTGPQYATEEEAKRNCPPLMIVCGERRWRAAGLKGKHKLNGTEYDFGNGLERLKVMVADTSAPNWEKRQLALQVAENQCRENLTALEEAAALKRECETEKADEVAKRHGMSRGSLFGKLRLLELTEPVKKALLAGEVSVSVAGLVAALPAQGNMQEKFLKEVTGDEWHGPISFRRAQERLESNYARQLGKAPFDTKRVYSGKGIVAAGDGMGMTCEACPKRSGNMEGSGLKNPNVCTQPICFEAKTRAHGALKLEEAKKAGRVVIGGKEGAKIFSEYGDQEPNYQSGFVEVSRRCDALGWDCKKDWGESLGKDLAGLQVTVAVDGNGVARELLRRSEATGALVKLGKLKKAERQTSPRKSAKDLAKEKENKERKELRENLVESAGVNLAKGIEKLKDDWAWELVERAIRETAYNDPRPDWLGSAKSAKGRAVLHAIAMDDGIAWPVDYEGAWNSEAVKLWKSLGIDLMALEKEALAAKDKTKAASRPTCRRTPKSKGKKGGKGK